MSALTEKFAWAFLAGAVLLLFISIATIDPQNVTVKMHDLFPLEQRVEYLNQQVTVMDSLVSDTREDSFYNYQRIDELITSMHGDVVRLSREVSDLKTGGVFARCMGVYEVNATHFGMNCEMVENYGMGTEH